MQARFTIHAFSKLIILSCLIAHVSCCFAGKDKTEYSFVNLNRELLENANAVIRDKTGTLQIINTERAIFTCRVATTVLNPKGKESGQLMLHYDLFNKIVKLKGKIYDGSGNFIRETKNKEIKDFALSAGSQGYTDNRVKVLELFYDQYPYTVEFEFAYKIKGLMDYPDWHFNAGQSTAVEKSSFIIETPVNFSIDYYLANLQIEADVLSRGDKTIYQWTAQDLKPFKYEKFQPPKREVLPILYSKPSVFRMGKYQGFSDSWKSFGDFFNQLNNERDLLDEAYADEIKPLIDGPGSDRKKVEVLYNYLQENTRYVNIQLGIGGWQCKEADEVHKTKYGDCKALVNYMKALLRIADIESFPVLVKAGENQPEINTRFPSNQFNHVILCVPFEKDSIWLECTSQEIPFGYLGTFTSNRYGLFCGESGGTLVRTPQSPAWNNRRLLSADIYLHKNGSANCKGAASFSGSEFEEPMQVNNSFDSLKMRDWFRENIDVPTDRIYSLKFSRKKENIPSIDLEFAFDSEGFASSSNNRLFFRPVFIKKGIKLLDYEERSFPVYNSKPSLNIDSVWVHIPSGYIIESMPEFPVEVRTEFGYFSADCDLHEAKETILFIMKLGMNRFNLPPERYSELVGFLNSFLNLHQEMLVLKKKPDRK